MYLQFDKKDIHIQLLIGALEEYTPSKKIQRIVDKVVKLKEERDEYLKLLTLEADMIEKMVNDENKRFQEEAAARKLSEEKAEHREKHEAQRQQRLDNPHESNLSDPQEENTEG